MSKLTQAGLGINEQSKHSTGLEGAHWQEFCYSHWPNFTSHAPMEFKCRESGHQKLAVGLSLKFHKERRERTTNRRSELQFLQILFQIRSLYYQNDLNLLGKPEGEKTVELA